MYGARPPHGDLTISRGFGITTEAPFALALEPEAPGFLHFANLSVPLDFSDA
jgi:hypothetical protein